MPRKPTGSNICTLIEEKLFETAPKNPTSMDCSILDYLHRATDIYLDDEAFAHHWHQDTVGRFISKQVLLDALELGASGRIGATSFGNFWTTRMDRMSHRRPPLKFLPRVIGQLPPLRVDITEELISSAKHGSNGRTVLDYVLGLDHDITIHQSALQKCARLGEELWLHRSLSRMSAEEIAVLDRDVLLEAACEGGNLSILKFCRSLARKPSRVALRQKSARELLRLAHYIMRQRLRHGRPRIARPLWRGFFRFRLVLKMRRTGVVGEGKCSHIDGTPGYLGESGTGHSLGGDSKP